MPTIAEDKDIRIERFTLGPYATNTYVLVCQHTKESVLVDAPAEAERILELLSGTSPRYILLTHNHMDHVGALDELAGRLKVPVCSSLEDVPTNPLPSQMTLADNDVVSFGDIKLRVLATPGHTPGSLCFLTGKYLLAGDTIFSGGPGRTRSSSAFSQITRSITEKIFVLPDDTMINPGHGEATVLKKEKEEFAVFQARSHSPDLCGDVVWLSS
ncbi:MAG: MBL fold metallo-hydrolase [Chloroflexota bacterium]